MNVEVRIIEPTVLPLIQSEAIIRVCAYCRVSSSSKEQLNSYASQISYFKAFIDSQPNWRLVEIYTDKGVSGRKTKNRDEFNQMIDDAYRGLFDMIICKSISRFARDIVTSLKICRELREKGIDVFFEEENIHTLFLKNEHYLSVRSALAQSESENISTLAKSIINWKTSSINPYITQSIFPNIILKALIIKLMLHLQTKTPIIYLSISLNQDKVN